MSLPAETGFGPSALVTPANAVTLGRLAVTPAFLAVVVAGGDSWFALAFWVLLASTDGFDGWLARRHGTTRSGAFLDPLADKFLVIGALLALAVKGSLPWLPVIIVTVREVAISGYRSWMGKRGVSVPARWWAKVKTVVQEVAVGFALLPLTADDHPPIATAVLWAGAVLAVFTGVQYLLDGRRVASAV